MNRHYGLPIKIGVCSNEITEQLHFDTILGQHWHWLNNQCWQTVIPRFVFHSFQRCQLHHAIPYFDPFCFNSLDLSAEKQTWNIISNSTLKLNKDVKSLHVLPFEHHLGPWFPPDRGRSRPSCPDLQRLSGAESQRHGAPERQRDAALCRAHGSLGRTWDGPGWLRFSSVGWWFVGRFFFDFLLPFIYWGLFHNFI